MSLSSINSFENHEVDVNRYITYVTPMQNLCTHCYVFVTRSNCWNLINFILQQMVQLFLKILQQSDLIQTILLSDLRQMNLIQKLVFSCAMKLSECLYWKMLNINPCMDGTYHCYPMRVKHNDNNNNLIFFSGQCDILSPCQNGATCLDEIDGYQCKCTDKWIGINCTGIWNIYLK